MTISRQEIFTEILNRFFETNKEIEAIIVSDEDGFVIAGEKREEINMEIVSFLTAVVNPILDRIRAEFTFSQFGTANFDTTDHRLLFISINERTTLSLVVNYMGSIERISPYAYLLAEKIAQIIDADEKGLELITIPDFKYEINLSKDIERICGQIYQQSQTEFGDDYSFKFIIIGDHEVGKTSIARRFVENRFSDDYRATIGLNISTSKFKAFGNNINISLWDIGAQDYFKRFRKTYYGGARAAFIVFDITNKTSFERVTTWHNELREFLDNEDIPVVIVGNKIDKEDQRQVSYEEGAALAKELSLLSDYYESSELSDYADLSDVMEDIDTKIGYIETSALSGERINEAFYLISYHYIIRNNELIRLRYKERFMTELKSIFEERDSLNITFITYDPMWSPGLQIFTDIEKLGEVSKVKDKKKEKIYKYPNGLVLKNNLYDNFKIDDETDAVFIIFDAREKESLDPQWQKMLISIIRRLKENKVLLIGVRATEKFDMSQLAGDFDINQELRKKFVSTSFFKIDSETIQSDVLKHLELMLKTINELIFKM